MGEVDAILQYLSSVNQAVAWVLQEDECLNQANIILARCMQIGITTNDTFMSLEAVHIFFDLVHLYALDNTIGGSSKGKRPNVERNREAAYERLLEDYFCADPKYSPEKFRRRFRMQRHVFDRIVEGVTSVDDYFIQKKDATGRLGAHPIQKVTAALRMLAYGTSADQIDE